MEVSWENDWPIFNRGEKLQLMFEAEATPAQPVSEWRDGFQESECLALGWYHKSIVYHLTAIRRALTSRQTLH